MAFHEIRFPANLSFGSIGGPERRTEIVTLANGFEERNQAWAGSRRRYEAGAGLRNPDDVALLIAFFEARRGRMHGFRWKDWTDFKSCAPSAQVSPQDQELGWGDGVRTTFALQKSYRSGGESYLRRIDKAVAGSVKAAVAHDPKVEGLEFSVEHDKGLITFAVAPDIGCLVTAGFEFDVPVRFDTDQLVASMASFGAGEVPDVPVVEIRV